MPPPQLPLKWKALCFHLNIWNFDLFDTSEDLSAVSSQTHLSHSVQWGTGSSDVTFSTCSVVYKTGCSQVSCGACISHTWAIQEMAHQRFFLQSQPLWTEEECCYPFAMKHEDCHPKFGGCPKASLQTTTIDYEHGKVSMSQMWLGETQPPKQRWFSMVLRAGHKGCR